MCGRWDAFGQLVKVVGWWIKIGINPGVGNICDGFRCSAEDWGTVLPPHWQD
jgi:hypothetical protein